MNNLEHLDQLRLNELTEKHYTVREITAGEFAVELMKLRKRRNDNGQTTEPGLIQNQA